MLFMILYNEHKHNYANRQDFSFNLMKTKDELGSTGT